VENHAQLKRLDEQDEASEINAPHGIGPDFTDEKHSIVSRGHARPDAKNSSVHVTHLARTNS
jgi:hypothetical protein